MLFPLCLSIPHLLEGPVPWVALSSSTSDGVDALPLNGPCLLEQVAIVLHGVKALASLPLWPPGPMPFLPYPAGSARPAKSPFLECVCSLPSSLSLLVPSTLPWNCPLSNR